MAGRFEIPGLMTSSEPIATQTQNQPNPQDAADAAASQVVPQSFTEMEVDAAAPVENALPPKNDDAEKKDIENADVHITDAPPSPPSLTSALEALLGGLEALSKQPGATTTLPNGTEQNGQTHEQETQGDPEWEEDSSPYESSSDSSSSDDSDDDSEDGKNYELLGPEETARILLEMEAGSDDEGEGKTKGLGSGAQLRTKNELPEEVVPKPDVTITPDMTITELGVVEHIVENTVVIKAHTTGEYQVLDTGSVLCTEGRTVVAAIADLIGNVRQPRYTARFTNEEEIKSFGLELGAKVFYPPLHATYVFTQALRTQKGTDASNWHDEEAGDDEMEFSDDEKEAEYKRQQKAKKKASRGAKGGAGAQGGHSEAPSFPVAGGLHYDDDDDDGPYRKLARPSSFAQGQPASSEPGFTNNHGNNNGSFRGGRGRGQRGFNRGRGHRGDSRGGYSLPPRPPRGQDYQPQPHQYNFNPAPPPPASNTTYPTPPLPFYGPPNGHQPNAQFPFPWPQNIPQGFIPPPPPQFTGQQAGMAPYYSPEFFAALQTQMQGQSNQQGSQWPGHGGAG